jgi:hypothetical protein
VSVFNEPKMVNTKDIANSPSCSMKNCGLGLPTTRDFLRPLEPQTSSHPIACFDFFEVATIHDAVEITFDPKNGARRAHLILS